MQRHFSRKANGAAVRPAAVKNQVPPPCLTLGLRELLDIVDDDGIWKLWRECRSRVSDCTAEEVLYIAREKLAGKNGHIQNPMGFLLTAIPKCFEGEALASFRQRHRKFPAESSSGRESATLFSQKNWEKYFASAAAMRRKSAAKQKPDAKRRILNIARYLEGFEIPRVIDEDAVRWLDRCLDSHKEVLGAILTDVATPEVIRRIRDAIAKELARNASYGKMNAEQRADVERKIMAGRLLEEFGAPRLTILEITPVRTGQATREQNPKRTYASAVESGYLFDEQP